ncbi:MFS transporter [Streptomyces sp. H27-D2]|uniref:MFS transporter n=1 Tax=Streptomyces sp. H27-D2 TaxID=3046304 RepID=UPI003FA72D80
MPGTAEAEAEVLARTTRTPGAAAGATTALDGGPLPPRWWVWLAAWPVVAVFVLSNAATPLYVLWQRELGFSSGTLTAVFASYIVGLLGSLLVAGVVSDRVGRKPVLLPALVLGAVASVFFATASTVFTLALARFLSGIAVGAVVSAGMAAVSDVAGPSRRRLAALLASTAMVVGAGVGPLLAGVLSETAPGPTSTVFVVEIALLVSAVVVVARLPLPRRADLVRDGDLGKGGDLGRGRDPRKGGGGAAAAGVGAGPRRMFGIGARLGSGRRAAARASGRWIRVPSVPREHRGKLLLGIAVFGPGLTSTSFVLSLGPSLLADLLDSDSRVLAGSMAFVMFMASTGVQFAVQRLRVRTILISGALSTAAGMAVLVLAVHTSSVVLLGAAAMLAGAGQGQGQLGGLSLLNSSLPSSRLAEANAALNVGGYLPAGAFPVAVGYLSDSVGLSTGATLFGTVMAGTALVGAALVVVHRSDAEPGCSTRSLASTR